MPPLRPLLYVADTRRWSDVAVSPKMGPAATGQLSIGAGHDEINSMVASKRDRPEPLDGRTTRDRAARPT
jgi:hypothetical protein